MAFAPVLRRPFGATFDGRTATASWWLAGGVAAVAAVAVYQPKGSASLAASYVNLASPGTYDAAPGVAPTFSAATGWTFNGLSQYLSSSGFAVANNQTSSILVRFSDATSSRGFLFGFAGEYGIQPNFDGIRKLYRSRNASQQSYPPGVTSGVVATAGLANFLNGAFLGNHTAFAAGANLTALAIGAQSVSAPGNYLNGKIQALAFYNATLSAAQVAAISAAMAAL